MKIKKLYKRARAAEKTIVFPEAGFSDRTIEAVKYISKKRLAKPLLVGDESALILRDKKLINFDIVNPKTFPFTEQLAKSLYKKRKEKGLTEEEAKKLVLDPYYFATMLVEEGYADGMVAGAEATTADTIRPALQIIKTAKKGKKISSSILVYGKNKFLKKKVLVISDCGIMPNPSVDEVVQIASDSVETYSLLGLENPKVAFLSYSTNGSSEGESVEKMRLAYAKFKKSGIKCDGELQFDSAMVPEIAKIKCPESPLEGDANILILPNLDTGNIMYKTLQYVGGLKAIGPIIQGLNKPVNDLSRGCNVDDIIMTTVITVLQCKKEEK